ncbi:hypothetical protein D3C81_923780 [compost metagenome]
MFAKCAVIKDLVFQAKDSSVGAICGAIIQIFCSLFGIKWIIIGRITRVIPHKLIIERFVLSIFGEIRITCHVEHATITESLSQEIQLLVQFNRKDNIAALVVLVPLYHLGIGV